MLLYGGSIGCCCMAAQLVGLCVEDNRSFFLLFLVFMFILGHSPLTWSFVICAMRLSHSYVM